MKKRAGGGKKRKSKWEKGIFIGKLNFKDDGLK